MGQTHKVTKLIGTANDNIAEKSKQMWYKNDCGKSRQQQTSVDCECQNIFYKEKKKNN